MTEVVPADRTKLLQSKRAECSAITRSRKRKLRELFVVATAEDGIPTGGPTDPDAPPINDAEFRFLEGCDILQGRTLNELNIPARPRPRYDVAKQGDPQRAPASTESRSASSSSPTEVDASLSRPTASTHTPPLPINQAHGVDQQNGDRARPFSKDVAPAAAPVLGRDQAESGSTRPTPSKVTWSAIEKPGQGATPTEDGITEERDPNNVPATESRVGRAASQHLQAGTVDASATSKRPVDARSKDDDGRKDFDETVETSEFDESSSLQKTAQSEALRPADAVSSPESTAQSATTPAVLDTSTNTSPDREGAQFERSEDARVIKPDNPGASNTSDDHVAGNVSSSREVEAQLLRDSAEAAQSKTASNVQEALSQATTSKPGEAASVMHDSVMTDVPSAQPGLSDVGPRKEARPGVLFEKQHSAHLPEAERIANRVSTGNLRQKSVSEILSGEYTKPSSEMDSHAQAPITPISQSPRQRAHSLSDRVRPRERSKLSTVVFGKQPGRPADTSKVVVPRHPEPEQLPTDDYFTPLFVNGFAANGAKWMKPLEQILHHAHKTVSSADSYMQILDSQSCAVLRRVYQLQQKDRWSLRQPKRSGEPPRPESHWDVLLKEAKWMRTDFREERKWKSAAARRLARACAEWVELKDCPDGRRLLEVNAPSPVTPPRPKWKGGELQWGAESDPIMLDGDRPDADSHPTPDLIHGDSDSLSEHQDEPQTMIMDTVPPSAIFLLEDDEVVFGLHHSPNADQMLAELPIYGSPLKIPEHDLISAKPDPDAAWKREALPVSKYVEGRMDFVSSEPPRKRSRFQYAQEEDIDDEAPFSEEAPSPFMEMPAENPDTALFQPGYKNIRDRLHAGHQFRPPNEYAMPFQTFYENRNCSTWTVSEDDELKSLVREYSYNWSLISTMLGTKSMFTSSAERRTPWECFERWVMLEGLPHDMQKTQYFKLWQNRIDAAQQVIRQQNQNALAQQAQQQQQQQAQQQQQQSQPQRQGSPSQSQQQQVQQQSLASGPVTPLIRRRLSLPLKVERRRNQKHLTMIDAMRKLAKKRETAVAKQQHAANLAAMRKAQEQPQPRTGAIKTPREYSIMRWERDQAMAEKLAERVAAQQRAEAQRKAAALQARAAQQGQAAQIAAAHNSQNPQNASMQQNGVQMAATHPMAGAVRPNGVNQMANGQARARMPGMQGSAPTNAGQTHSAGTLVPPMQMNSNGQVQMPVVNGQARMAVPTQPDINLVLQAQRISDQQRQAVQMRQAQHQSHGVPQASPQLQNSSPAMRANVPNGVNQKAFMNGSPGMMGAFNGVNNAGLNTPPAPGLNMPNGQASSPRPNAPMPQQIHQTYLSQLQHIESQIRQQNPSTPQDLVREMAKQVLQNRHNNLAQSAMNAAAGGQGPAATLNGPHQYAQMLRAQQQTQAAAAAQAQAQQQNAQHQRNSSGSATPPVPNVAK